MGPEAGLPGTQASASGPASPGAATSAGSAGTAGASAEVVRRGLLRSAAALTVLTFVSRLLGLVREQVRSYYLGTGTSSDAFGLASTLPNLFRRLLGEGAMTAAFVPIFSGYVQKGDQKKLTEFLGAFLTLFTVVTAIVCIVGIGASPWIVETFFTGFARVEGKVALTAVLTQIMFPYLFLVCLAAVAQGALNSFKVFSPSAFTPILLNLAIIALAVLTADLFPDPAYAFAAGFLVGGLFQLVFQLPWFFRLVKGLRLSFNWNHPGVREMIRVFLPGTLTAGIYQVNVFISELIASSLNEGSIAALQFSIRLQELVLGVFVISMTTVILPTLAGQMASGDRSGFGDTHRFALKVLAFVTLPAAVGLIALRRPIVSLLFRQGAFDDHSTDMTAWAVLFHSLGIYFIGMSRSLNQAFYAMKDLKTPMMVSAAAVAVDIGGSLGFSRFLDHGGIALANSASAATSTVLMFILLHRRGVDTGFKAHAWLVARLLGACGMMWGAIAALSLVLPLEGVHGKLYLVAALAAYVVAALAAFGVGCVVLARGEVRGVLELVRRRRGR